MRELGGEAGYAGCEVLLAEEEVCCRGLARGQENRFVGSVDVTAGEVGDVEG